MPPANDNSRQDVAIDRITELTAQSYELAKSIDHGMLTYLLGMVLAEIGEETADTILGG